MSSSITVNSHLIIQGVVMFRKICTHVDMFIIRQQRSSATAANVYSLTCFLPGILGCRLTVAAQYCNVWYI